MSDVRKPLFLARQTYRHRRVIDASRLLPVVGLVLFLLPLLWDQDGQAHGHLAETMLYLFAVWFGLVIVSRIIAARLRPGDLMGPEQARLESAGTDLD